MNRVLRQLFLLLVVAGGTWLSSGPAPAMDFVHPGLLDSREELELMKRKVRAGDEPWKTAYAKLPAFLDYRPHPVVNYTDGKGRSDGVRPFAVRGGHQKRLTLIHCLGDYDDHGHRG